METLPAVRDGCGISPHQGEIPHYIALAMDTVLEGYSGTRAHDMALTGQDPVPLIHIRGVLREAIKDIDRNDTEFYSMPSHSYFDRVDIINGNRLIQRVFIFRFKKEFVMMFSANVYCGYFRARGIGVANPDIPLTNEKLIRQVSREMSNRTIFESVDIVYRLAKLFDEAGVVN